VGVASEATGLPGEAGSGWSGRHGIILEGQDFFAALINGEAAGEKLLKGDQEGVGREKLLQSYPVPQVGEFQVDLEVVRHLSENLQLLDFRLAHLAFDLEQQFAQMRQIVFPFLVVPVFVPEKVNVLLAQQGAVGDDFAHGAQFSSGNVSSHLADLNEKG
jgi:hypothetical protein